MRATDGYFGPESVIRRLGNSPLLPLLGGGPAALLQVAHPLVAAGVAEHSDYRNDLWRRFVETLRALYFIVYGSREEADRAGAVVQAVHRTVRGRLDHRMGPFPAGTPYAADDPDLMLWVHATLVETSLAVHRRFISRLTTAEVEDYYRDMAVVGRIFGMPPDVIPPTLAEFRAYFAAELASGRIVVTPEAREVAAAIKHAPFPFPLRWVGPAQRLSAGAFLPEPIRGEYGLAWGPLRAVALGLAGRSLRLGAAPLFAATARLKTPALA
jgi:uncharacterized protein (DUF2236 family)